MINEFLWVRLEEKQCNFKFSLTFIIFTLKTRCSGCLLFATDSNFSQIIKEAKYLKSQIETIHLFCLYLILNSWKKWYFKKPSIIERIWIFSGVEHLLLPFTVSMISSFKSWLSCLWMKTCWVSLLHCNKEFWG